jgi:catechol 2,3-dioxygenase-like lactoylglutathione lyase family enzyme
MVRAEFISRAAIFDTLFDMSFRISSVDHVQVAAPAGCERAAREFYGSILGMQEVVKPKGLRARGGCWFQCGRDQLHIGVEKDFRAAEKAHPAFVVTNLHELRATLQARGIPIIEDDNIVGLQRFYVHDPWGNRLEFIESKK